VITNGLVFLSVLALVLFGGDVLRAFSLALFIGVVFGTYSSIAIASPIMVWWEQRIEAANREAALSLNQPRVVKPARTPKQGLKNASKPLH
jgi:preprotein translocase subunit SecF